MINEKYYKTLLIVALILFTFLFSSCDKNTELENDVFSTTYNYEETEEVTYRVEDGKVDNDSFVFDVPKNYKVVSTFNNISVENQSRGITISVEENTESSFDADSYIEMLKQQFSAFNICVEEKDEIEVSGTKARKVLINGLSKISKNECMYCYLIPTEDKYLIVSVSLVKDNAAVLSEAETFIKSITIK